MAGEGGQSILPWKQDQLGEGSTHSIVQEMLQMYIVHHHMKQIAAKYEEIFELGEIHKIRLNLEAVNIQL